LRSSGVTDGTDLTRPNPQIKELARQQRAREWAHESEESKRSLEELRPYLLTEDLLKPFVIEQPTTPTEEKTKPILEEIRDSVAKILNWTEEKHTEPSEFMTTEEVAQLVGMSVKTIRRWWRLAMFSPSSRCREPDTTTASSVLRSWNGLTEGNLGTENDLYPRPDSCKRCRGMDIGTSIGIGLTVISLVLNYVQWLDAKRQSDLMRRKSDLMTGFLLGIKTSDLPARFMDQANDVLARIDPPGGKQRLWNRK
jgi:hypothetical protein